MHKIEKMRADSLFIGEVKADLEERVAKRPDILHEEPGLRVVASLVGAKFAREGEHAKVSADQATHDLIHSIRKHLFRTVPEGVVSNQLDYFLINAAIGLTRPEDSNEKWRREVGDASALFSREYLERYTQSLMERAEAKKGICTTITGDMRRRLYDVKALLVASEHFGRDQNQGMEDSNLIPPDACETEMVAPQAITRRAGTQPVLRAAERRESTPNRMRRIASDIGNRLERVATSVVAFKRPKKSAAPEKAELRV